MNIPNNLYVLKHKDDDVAMVQVNLHSGALSTIISCNRLEKRNIGKNGISMKTIFQIN